MTTLACTGLEFGYGELDPVIAGFSVAVEAGQMVGITGPSGRGKSTLLYLLGLMLTPRAGQVFIDDQAVSNLPDADRSRLRSTSFGFVFQDAALDHTRTVMDNILEVCLYGDLDPRPARARALDLMKDLGVDSPPDRRPGQISGGQAQRIALCRALIHEPPVLLADEPTGNLDTASADGVIATIRGYADIGNISVVVTHDPRVEEVCDQVIRL